MLRAPDGASVGTLSATARWTGPEDLEVGLSAFDGFCGESVHLRVGLQGDRLASVDASGSWSSDVGPSSGRVERLGGTLVYAWNDTETGRELDLEFELKSLDPDGQIFESGGEIAVRPGVYDALGEAPAIEASWWDPGFGEDALLEGRGLVVFSGDDPRDEIRRRTMHVYERDSSRWRHAVDVEVPESDPGAGFLWAASLKQGVVAVASASDRPGAGGWGSVRLYAEAAGLWREVARLDGSCFEQRGTFGGNLAFDGQTLLVGATIGTEPMTNLVGVFERSEDTWTLVQTLESPQTGEDPPRFGTGFGNSLALDGERLLVGQLSGQGGEPGGGRVFWYERVDSLWRLKGEIRPIGGAGQQGFGRALALSGDLAAVVAPFRSRTTGGGTSIDVYRLRDGTWEPQCTLEGRPDAYPVNLGRGAGLLEDPSGVMTLLAPGFGAPAAAFLAQDGAWGPSPLLELGGVLAPCERAALLDWDRDRAVVAAVGCVDRAARLEPARVLVLRRTGQTWELEQQIVPPWQEHPGAGECETGFR